jgi:hypothetical protein
MEASAQIFDFHFEMRCRVKDTSAVEMRRKPPSLRNTECLLEVRT